MRKRGIFVLLFLGVFLTSACSSYFGQPVASRVVDKETLLLQRMDVSGNGEIDNDDFFAFTNAFDAKKGGGGNANGYVYAPDEKYNGFDRLDFNDNNAIEQDDFFLLSDRFGRRYSLAAEGMVGDFNEDKCVDDRDKAVAISDIESWQKRFSEASEAERASTSFVAQYARAMRKYDLDNDNGIWTDADVEEFDKHLGEGCEQDDLGSIPILGDDAAKPALDLNCEVYEGQEKDYCWDLLANDVNNLDAVKCENIMDEVLRGYCRERNCLFAGNCAEKTIQAFHADSLEFSSEEYAALQGMDEQAVLGKDIAFTIQAPEHVRFAKIDFKFEHPLSGKPSIGYFREDTLEIEQASYETFIPLVSVRVDWQNGQYVNYADYIKVNQWDAFPVVDGKVSFKLVPQDRVYTAVSGLRISARDTFVLNQLFEKISFAADQNSLSQGRFVAVMDSGGKLQMNG